MNVRSVLGRAWSAVAIATAFAAGPVVAQPMFVEQGATVLGGLNLESRSASVADVDGDGDLDLFFQGGTGSQQLFRNNIIGTGSLTFTNITSTIPTSTLGSSWSAAWGDYNGDHKIDVFVGQTNSGSARGDVLRNNGASFSNTSTATGLNDPGFHQNVAWSDIDNDRDLDLLIGMEGPEKHEIYLQDSFGHFTPVGAAVGFQAAFGTKGYGMAIGDSDGDGDMDVYMSTCQVGGNIRNNFFKNMLVETGSLGFVDIADTNGTQMLTNTYGTEFMDFDNDGDLDLYVTGADTQPTKMFRNDGNNMFTDVDTITGHPLLKGIVGSDFNGSRAVDYDNDGDLDLFFHDQHFIRDFDNSARRLFRNDGNWEFTEVTAAMGLAATNEGAYDSVWADLDRDGDQDLVAATASQNTDGVALPERVFISNASTNGNHWLYLRLAGTKENTTGIGASLYATINEGTPEEVTLRREANTNADTFNQSDLPVHFGLGAATTVDELRIVWPDGTEQILQDVAANQYATIRFPGDFDGDGEIDAADLAQWKGDFGVNADSDSNRDGFTDGADFLAWQRQLGKGNFGATPVSGAVPEPAAACLAAVLATSLLVRRRS